MSYWWVNQNQTYPQEVGGGYLWSPKRNANDARNHFYETMRVVAPGDMVFSFCDTRIKAIGVVRSLAYESPRPEEFGRVGMNWQGVGWRVDVEYRELAIPFHPVEHMDLIRLLLPERYAPLQRNGKGLQGVYLTELPVPLADVLASLAGQEAAVAAERAREVAAASPLLSENAAEVEAAWEADIERAVAEGHRNEANVVRDIRSARFGRGVFRRRVLDHEQTCRLSGVHDPSVLICRHIKPWRHSDDYERVDGENGLLLCPNADFLFSRGLIGFEANGDFLVAPAVREDLLLRLNLDPATHPNVGTFTERQAEFLRFHRERLLLRAAG
ncbi:MAG: HNH endonuclease [Kiritimatiellia bacterium]